MKKFAIVHNVRSLHNVGSIFRTADAAGVKKIYLTGYTPKPVDVFGNYRKEISKTALGAEKYIPWEYNKNISSLITKLKKGNIFIVALEQSKRAVAYNKLKKRRPLALIVGNEVRGLSRSVLKKSDAIISIPMRGKKESLNVAVAFGIAMFSILDSD
ncbi:TrmH family RNA methyltransferase [Patescibacteria group bacterium]